jgi:hypothetical protein
MADLTPDAPEVIAQKNKLVGDEEVQAEVHSVEPDVNTDSVKAQVAPEREKPSTKVPVHETSVKLDEVITDPSSPLAVQVPDAGRGDASLPIHRLANPTPEDVFSSEASESVERDESEAREDPNPTP